jgi:Reverse transcriptase (RNA-dependent DNA polymerase)
LTSPLLDIEGILRRAASKPFCSALDLKSTYKQICIIPEHVEQSTVTTPDGNMVSQVIQIGDCNTPATYQVLMNHLFSSYISQFMDVYLDDIIIYSDILADHMTHINIILNILKWEKLYLCKEKLRFLAKELHILGQIINIHGI